ncbi:MAG: glutaredoxin 3 [Gammaproteobacteria bacterium]|nr:glutaredoxin 3 [Gammaproteobacteria bacterium]
MNSRRVKLYGNATCPFCGAARMLLKKKAVEFEDIDVAGDPEMFAEMLELSDARTVPQIFIDGVSIGGFDELHALDKNGDLDKLLAE